MNVILLSGGSGKRLWPLSNEVRSKQFIKIFKKEDGTYESMLQRVYGQIKAEDPDAKITIATSKSQVSAINNQLGENVNLSIEPCRRDTFPAIALAAAYLKDVCGAGEDESVVILPVDPFVEADYFKAIRKLSEHAVNSESNISLLGISPTYPSEKYGYIMPAKNDEVSDVRGFKEKPNLELAEEYITAGALWNGGVFALTIKYVLEKAKEFYGFSDHASLMDKYDTLEKISFDYAVVEKEEKIDVLRFNGEWKDVGTWNTLAEVMKDNISGNATLDSHCENVHVVNELDMPILGLALKNLIIAASPEGILVSDKSMSSHMKPFVEKIEGQVMFAEKSWGSYRVLEVGAESLTIKVTLNPGNAMNYHSHLHRDEIWTVTEGEGIAIINDEEIPVKPGSVITMNAGVKHCIKAITELKVIEVQIGKSISVKDKIKY